jgi:outer membrane protein assembly factor BamE
VRLLFRVLLAAALPALAGCGGVTRLLDSYTIEIQQGNFVSQEMVSQLKPGMSKEQVRFVLGTPLVSDIFHADRWDYVYYRKIPGGKTEERKVAVFFKDGRLVRLEGDVVAASERERFREVGG